jgi:hypothetical protein
MVKLYYQGGEGGNSKQIVDNICQVVEEYKDIENASSSPIELIKKFTEIVNAVFFKKQPIKRNYFFYVNLNYSKEELKYINALKDIWAELFLRIAKNASTTNKQEEINVLLDLIRQQKKNNRLSHTSASQLIDFHCSQCGFFRLGSTNTRSYLDLVLVCNLSLENYNSYKESSATTVRDQLLTL